MLVKKYNVEFSAEISILKSSESKKVVKINMNVVVVCRLKGSAKAVGPILFEFSHNLYLMLE